MAASIPATHPQSTRARAAIARSQGAPLTIEEIDVAVPRADEVLVRLVATGICHTDLVCLHGFPVPMPIVLGHEGAGVVEALGADVKGLAVGDHVLLSFNSCGACANCADHEPAYCHQFMGRNFAGVRLEDGSSPLSQNGSVVHGEFFGQSSFATFAVSRAVNTVKVDKALPLATLAPLGCGIQTGAGAVLNALKVKKGRAIGVFGAGAVGLSAVMAGRIADAGAIVVVEPNAQRRALALALGASHAFDPQAGDVVAAVKAAIGGLDYAFDTTGIPAVMKSAVDLLLPNGTLGVIGIPPPDAPFPFSIMDIYTRGIGVKCIVEGDSDPHEFIPRLIGFYREGRLPLEKLIREFPFERINDAFAAAADGSVIKPILTFRQ
ncbi:MAG: NAD(P)-dependent alcohol dehydrogenase [Rudaea sp.]|uniref:NAD(P)-dependent alcohol dehydrogenase n=1 Tax=Rudaea sp. TaxID=2136325 RepID=UPI0039E3E080